MATQCCREKSSASLPWENRTRDLKTEVMCTAARLRLPFPPFPKTPPAMQIVASTVILAAAVAVDRKVT
jgi:hypothetical protein